MKSIKILFFVCALYLSMANTSAQVYATASGKTIFYSTARLEDIEATSKNTNVVLNTTTNEVLFKVLISSFVFKNGLLQEHFNETYMESDKNPYAQFKGKINETINYAVAGEFAVTVTGSLLIHGISVNRTIPGTLKIAQGSITLVSNFIVPVSAHQIDIPNDKISNIAQDIKVSVYAVCPPYVKK